MRVKRFVWFLVLSLAAVTAQAGIVCSFTGGGAGPGTDAPCGGHDWSWQLTGSQTQISWGIPGLGQGVEPYAGRGPVTDFHIEFFGLPPTVGIATEPAPTGPGGTDESTRFSNISDFVLWNRSISGATADFWAPSPAGWLDPGDGFFVNIVFTGTFDLTDVRFEASYTNDAAVPEPGTWGLMAGGLAGVWAFNRRRLSRRKS